jgi:hypothetical protein
MIKIIKKSFPVILALSAAALPAPAHGFNDSNIDEVSLSHSGGNLSTTLTWLTEPSAGQDEYGAPNSYFISQIRVYGHNSAVSAGVSSSFPSGVDWIWLNNQVSPPSTSINLTQTTSTANLNLSPNLPHVSVCWYLQKPNYDMVYACSDSIPNPTLGTVSSQPSLSLTGSTVNATLGTWTAGSVTHLLYACTSTVPVQTSVEDDLNNLTEQYGCMELQSQGGMPSNLVSANVPLAGMAPYNPTSHGSNIVLLSRVSANSQFVWTAGVVYSGGSSGGSESTAEVAPAKYSGPEFSSLSLKPVMHDSSTTLTGKRLTQVSSIEIGGKAATFTATSDTELTLTPAADLAPGTYDLVINSAAGKLTHMNAVRIQPALRSFSVTTRAENRITEEQYQEHSLIASMQQSELTKARCIVNGPNLAQAKAQAERLCALVKAANPNIETTVVEARSTVRNSAVFARVTYGWN